MRISDWSSDLCSSDLIANRNRNLVLFPNLVINDHISLTIRCTEPVAPDAMDVTVWGLAPEEEASNTVAVKRRLTSFIEFLGPGGFATPDDIEALELCQTGFANIDRKSTRLNSSHQCATRLPSSA